MLEAEEDLAQRLERAMGESDPKVRSTKCFQILSQPPFCHTDEDFARGFLKIRDKEGNVVFLNRNPPQRRLDEAIARQMAKRVPQRIIVPKARQEGVSTWAESVIFGRVARVANRNGLVVAHKKDSSRHIFNMSRFMLKNMPYQLTTEFSNRWEVVFDSPHNSALHIETAENRDAGRSYTNHYVHCSEVAFWPAPGYTMAGLVPTVPDIPDTLIVLESTGNGVGDFFYDTYMSAKDGNSDYEAVFLPWFDDPKYVMPCPEGTTMKTLDLEVEEQMLAKEHGLSVNQILWRRWKISQMSGNMDLFRQEYPATDQECFLASGRPVFRSDKITEAYSGGREPLFRGRVRCDEGRPPRIEESMGGPLTVWTAPQPGGRYVMGVDTAQGFATSDFSVASILDADTMEQVAEFAGRWDVSDFASYIVALARIYNDAFVAIEINNHGLSVLQGVREQGYWNLLNRKGYDSVTHAWINKQGWQTSVKTRPILVDSAVQCFHMEDGAVIHSKELLRQMSRFNFVQGTSGEWLPSTPKGDHDDHLFAWMIAIQAHKHQCEGTDFEKYGLKSYSGQDAWAWRAMDKKIRHSEREKRQRLGPDTAPRMDKWL